MINSNEAYLLGLLYGKGTIDPVDDSNVILNFRVKFRRPTDQSLRADNIHTIFFHYTCIFRIRTCISHFLYCSNY